MDTDPAMVNYLLSSSEGKAGIVSIWEWNMSHRQMAKTSIAGIASQRAERLFACRGTGNIRSVKSMAGRDDFFYDFKLPFVPNIPIEAQNDGFVVGRHRVCPPPSDRGDPITREMVPAS